VTAVDPFCCPAPGELPAAAAGEAGGGGMLPGGTVRVSACCQAGPLACSLDVAQCGFCCCFNEAWDFLCALGCFAGAWDC
jgi:hypothetical protein